MRMKTFQAETMHEALLQIKNELGPEAVILRTRKSSRKLLGRNKDFFEVTAALDESLYVKPEPPKTFETSGSQGIYNRTRKVEAQSAGNPLIQPDFQEPQAKKDLAITEDKFDVLLERVEGPQKELKNLKGDFDNLMVKVDTIRNFLGELHLDKVNPEFQELYQTMLEADIQENLARELTQRLEHTIPLAKRDNQEHIRRVMTRIVSNRIPCAQDISFKPGRPRVVMLVGPTGVGKTTTIAKLAGVYQFEKHKKVGIISADCYRLGATEQMRAFCKAVGIPLCPVFSPEDTGQALKDLADRELILVDTAGRTQNHPEMWRELKLLIQKVQPDETHLVVSCATNNRDLMHICRLYKELDIAKLIFTKLDESLNLGCIYNIGATQGLPVSFVCNGQDIPDSILPAESDTLASLVLETVPELQV